MGVLADLYQAAVIQHSRRPSNFGKPESFDVSQDGVNSGCGDELTLYLSTSGDVLTDVRFEGVGCAISMASASLMTEAVKGSSADEALALADAFKRMIRGEEPDEKLGENRVLQGVSRLHARVKCATLPWLTLEQAIAKTPDKG